MARRLSSPAFLADVVFRRCSVFGFRGLRGSRYGKVGVKSVAHYFPTAIRLFLPNGHVLAAIGGVPAVGTLGGQLVGIERVSQVTGTRHFHFVDLPLNVEAWAGHQPRPGCADGILAGDRGGIGWKPGGVRREVGNRGLHVLGLRSLQSRGVGWANGAFVLRAGIDRRLLLTARCEEEDANAKYENHRRTNSAHGTPPCGSTASRAGPSVRPRKKDSKFCTVKRTRRITF